jgi:hypothetical protein
MRAFDPQLIREGHYGQRLWPHLRNSLVLHEDALEVVVQARLSCSIVLASRVLFG